MNSIFNKYAAHMPHELDRLLAGSRLQAGCVLRFNNL